LYRICCCIFGLGDGQVVCGEKHYYTKVCADRKKLPLIPDALLHFFPNLSRDSAKRGEDFADVHPLEKLAAAVDHHRMIVDDENSHAPRFAGPSSRPMRVRGRLRMMGRGKPAAVSSWRLGPSVRIGPTGAPGSL
jgi:hypothetical protein